MGWKTLTEMHQRSIAASILITVLVGSCGMLPVPQAPLTAAPTVELLEVNPTSAEPVVDPTAPLAAPPAAATDAVPTIAEAIVPVPKPPPVRLFYYVVEEGTPVLMPAFRPEEITCDWMGVGGQAFDAFDQPVIDLVVLLKGTLNGDTFELFTLTGSATAFGPGGYEFMLANAPVASENTLYVSLYDSYGNRLSSDIYFRTSDQCDSNLVLVNFKEFYFENGSSVLLPLIFR